MSERIDHAAASVDMLKDAQEAGSDLELLNTIVNGAHVHAALALVEQQRIANLIAYVAKWTDDELLDVDTEIRKGLGL